MKAVLALENGMIFTGESFGAQTTARGEVCFNTSMTGYQEILTDPSYKGQIIAMTYPEIGNYGVNIEDIESGSIKASGFIVKNACEFPSSWRKGKGLSGEITTLSQYLKAENIPGIKGIDTRRLVKVLREKGSMNGILAAGDASVNELLKEARQIPAMAGQDLASTVSTQACYDWEEKEHEIKYSKITGLEEAPLIIVMDFGIKYNILRILSSLGAKVKVVPASTSSREILALHPDGLMLSNGPGDPEPVQYAVETIKELLNTVPVFGICLGHQLLSMALGGRTYKLKFGHRGANHPIKNLLNGSVAITSQNHGFAVDSSSLNLETTEITHVNLNDNTVAGIRHKTLPVFSVQYHPEASPGPKDSEQLFTQFVEYAVSHLKRTSR